MALLCRANEVIEIRVSELNPFATSQDLKKKVAESSGDDVSASQKQHEIL